MFGRFNISFKLSSIILKILFYLHVHGENIMTVEPTCPNSNCKSREDFQLMEWPIKDETGVKEIKGSFVFCGRCGTVINWIPEKSN